ncbi:hypothetical protein [Escherichia coli]|nr:hypothetical protein [Escherichia coli]
MGGRGEGEKGRERGGLGGRGRWEEEKGVIGGEEGGRGNMKRSEKR